MSTSLCCACACTRAWLCEGGALQCCMCAVAYVAVVVVVVVVVIVVVVMVLGWMLSCLGVG